MENTLLIGLSRQIALEREIDVVANNIANLGTTGYKADGTVFEEFLMPVAAAEQFSGSDQQLSYVQDRATWHNISQGPIKTTGNALDVAVDGDAYFVVESANGERYTRNGAFQINADGELVTSVGDRVIGNGGPILFQPGDSAISISQDGTITVREGGDSGTEAIRGNLQLVRFEEAARLQKDGASLFLAPEGVDPLTADDARVVQGAIELSNVHGVLEMSRMIEITRAYQQVSQLLQQETDMRNNAINELADVPA